MSGVRKAEWSWWPAGLALGLLSLPAVYTANCYLSAPTASSRAT